MQGSFQALTISPASFPMLSIPCSSHEVSKSHPAICFCMFECGAPLPTRPSAPPLLCLENFYTSFKVYAAQGSPLPGRLFTLPQTREGR